MRLHLCLLACRPCRASSLDFLFVFEEFHIKMVVYCNRLTHTDTQRAKEPTWRLLCSGLPASFSSWLLFSPPASVTFRVLLSGKRVHLAPTRSRHIALPLERRQQHVLEGAEGGRNLIWKPTSLSPGVRGSFHNLVAFFFGACSWSARNS